MLSPDSRYEWFISFDCWLVSRCMDIPDWFFIYVLMTFFSCLVFLAAVNKLL